MAGKNAQPVALELIKLNEVLVGKRTLRYIYLYPPDVVSTERNQTCECTPLFLGSDVLLECNISSGNLPRVHAKHAKRGLATKLNFPPGTRVLGIHGTTRGVWFYSIQGTFKIAFDFYSREDQDGCLRQLQNVWRRQILDPVLQNELQAIVRQEADLSHEPQCGEILEVNKVDSEPPCDAVIHQINKTIDNFTLVSKPDKTLQQELELLRTYMSFMNVESNNCFVSRMLNLMKACLALLPTLSENHKVSEREVILSEIARWLGTEFSNYHAHVNERVTAFKQKHIKTIENLPSAEVVVNEVFPASMQILLRCWLQVRSADHENPTSEGSESSTNPQAATLFPIVQLILELANQNLLSGVAHVLYSRLIRSDSV